MSYKKDFVKENNRNPKITVVLGGDDGIRTHVPAHHRQNDFEFSIITFDYWCSPSFNRKQMRIKKPKNRIDKGKMSSRFA